MLSLLLSILSSGYILFGCLIFTSLLFIGRNARGRAELKREMAKNLSTQGNLSKVHLELLDVICDDALIFFVFVACLGVFWGPLLFV